MTSWYSQTEKLLNFSVKILIWFSFKCFMFASCSVSVTFEFDFNSKIVMCCFLQRLSHLVPSDSLNLYVCCFLSLLWSFICGTAVIRWRDICSAPFSRYLLVFSICKCTQALLKSYLLKKTSLNHVDGFLF